MKYRMWIASAALTLSAAALTGCGGSAAGASGSSPAVSAADSSAAVAPVASPSGNVSAGIAGNGVSDSAYITEEQAKAIALENAGLAEADTQYLHVRLDYDDGVAEYDVEFVSGADEYDYDIDAVTGEICSMERDTEDHLTAGQASSGEYIGEDAAQARALEHVGLAQQDVSFVHTKLEQDDGRWKYEVGFCKGSTEYDYDIDAVTGEVLSCDYDAEHCTAPAAGAASGEELTAEQAKQIALAHAGFAESEAQYLELGMDRDHGRMKYEIEWRVGRTEYSCAVDGSTGEVLRFKKELDD